MSNMHNVMPKGISNKFEHPFQKMKLGVTLQAKTWRIITAIFLATVIYSVRANAQKDGAFKGFNAELWKKDSTGCLSIRLNCKYGDILYCDRGWIVGMTKTQLMAWVGKPNNPIYSVDGRQLEVLDYYIGYGIQCVPNSESTDVRTLSIYVQNEVVSRVIISNGSAPNCTFSE